MIAERGPKALTDAQSEAVMAYLMSMANTVPTVLEPGLLEEAGWDRLDVTQRLKILKQIDQMAPEASSITSMVPDPAQVDEWVNVGEHIGAMITGTAKSVGIAANEFVNTPVGMMAMGLIVWHYMGSVLVHMFGALMVLGLGLGTLWYSFTRSSIKSYEYSPDKKDIFGRARIKSITRSHVSGEKQFAYLGGAAVVLFTSIVVAFTF